MEFKSLKNIETSFRQIRLFGIVFLCLCALVSVFSVVASFRFAEKQREKRCFYAVPVPGDTSHRNN